MSVSLEAWSACAVERSHGLRPQARCLVEPTQTSSDVAAHRDHSSDAVPTTESSPCRAHAGASETCRDMHASAPLTESAPVTRAARAARRAKRPPLPPQQQPPPLPPPPRPLGQRTTLSQAEHDAFLELSARGGPLGEDEAQRLGELRPRILREQAAFREAHYKRCLEEKRFDWLPSYADAVAAAVYARTSEHACLAYPSEFELLRKLRVARSGRCADLCFDERVHDRDVSALPLLKLPSARRALGAAADRLPTLRGAKHVVSGDVDAMRLAREEEARFVVTASALTSMIASDDAIELPVIVRDRAIFLDSPLVPPKVSPRAKATRAFNHLGRMLVAPPPA